MSIVLSVAGLVALSFGFGVLWQWKRGNRIPSLVGPLERLHSVRLRRKEALEQLQIEMRSYPRRKALAFIHKWEKKVQRRATEDELKSVGLA